MASPVKKQQPREKLAAYGPSRLTDIELLCVLIGSGNQQVSAKAIAAQILKLLKEKGSSISYSDLARIKGMGPAKTCEIIATFELGKRYLMPADRPVVTTAEEAAEQLCNIRDKKQECLVVLTLDGANRLINNTIVFQGTLNQSIIHPREIFAQAIEDRAASIIVAHNHPSGSLEPSDEDRQVTAKLREAGQLLGIELLDSLIVSRLGHASIK